MMSGVEGDLDELVAGWRQFSVWLAGVNRPGYRTWNRHADRLAAVLTRVLADPAGFSAVEQVAATDPDPLVRDYARQALDPGVPFDEPGRERWARHPRVGLSGVALRWAPGALLVPASSMGGESEDGSHLCGDPAGPLPEWPRRRDGLALILVAQIDLGAFAVSFGDVGLSAITGLPFHGVLQVFHDLETGGNNPAEGEIGAWLVRHVPSPAARVAPPEDLNDEHRQPAIPARLVPFTAVEPAADQTPKVADAFERAERRLVDAVRRQTAAVNLPASGHDDWIPDDVLDRDPALGRLTRVLGVPQLPAAQAFATLTTVRPSVTDWRLLVAVPGTGPLEGTFGDLGYLEVWCPAADLLAGRLDAAWVLIRR
jgi:hypothetical protein